MSQINFENAKAAFFEATPSGSLVDHFMEATRGYGRSMNFFELKPKFALSKQLDTSPEAITATIQRGVITAFVLPALSSISALYNGVVGVGKLGLAIVAHIKGKEEDLVKEDLNLAFQHLITAVADFAVAFFGIVVAVANFVTPEGVQLVYEKIYVDNQEETFVSRFLQHQQSRLSLDSATLNKDGSPDQDYQAAVQSEQPSLIKQVADFLTNKILPQKE